MCRELLGSGEGTKPAIFGRSGQDMTRRAAQEAEALPPLGEEVAELGLFPEGDVGVGGMGRAVEVIEERAEENEGLSVRAEYACSRFGVGEGVPR